MKILSRLAVFAFAASILSTPLSARADSAEEINIEVAQSLKKLYAQNPVAQALGQQAVGVLVFPSIVKGGFIVTGQFGEGALIEEGVTTGYYSSAGASAGFQAGAEKFGYALFFMNDKALAYLKKSKGWSIGAGPSLVLVDKGFAKDFSTTTARKDIYAVVFNQKGLMGGVGIQGTKITRIRLD